MSVGTFWRALFPADFPVEIEIGPGTGAFILSAAQRCPHVNFLGIEHARGRAAHLQATIGTLALANARVLAADASCVVTTVIPAESVAAYHIYFPDPWWKRRHHRRRLFTSAFAAGLARTVVPGGRVYVATDVDDVRALACKALNAAGAFALDGAASPRPATTVFERKGLARGATISNLTFIKLPTRRWAQLVQSSNAAPMTPAESPN